MPDVLCRSYPLKILNPIIAPNCILVINNRERIWIWNERFRHQTMKLNACFLFIRTKIKRRVALPELRAKDARPIGYNVSSAKRIMLGDANATDGAYLISVETFDGSPNFHKKPPCG